MQLLEQRIRGEAAPAGGDEPPAGPTGTLYPWWRSPMAPIGVAIALFVVVLGTGVLIGNSGNDQPQQASAPQVITVPVASTGTTAAPVELTLNDWPSGQEGYTVQLQALPKEGTQQAAVDAAKADATAKGATEVGALDSDNFASLDPGNVVIYSGVNTTKKEAQAALKKLKTDFPDAEVVQVSASAAGSASSSEGLTSGKKKSGTASKQQLQDLQKLSPEEYQKKAAKLPDETATQGKPPPTDKKPAGGGDGGGETIK